MLRDVNHDVLTVNEAGLQGKLDSLVFNYARQEHLVLLTHNCGDFKILHETHSNHPGILAIYKNDDPAKDMSFKAIVRAIANLEAIALDLTNQFIVLNHWNY
jgi:predicted nuclease of predicted toxin-antitoxin system